MVDKQAGNKTAKTSNAAAARLNVKGGAHPVSDNAHHVTRLTVGPDGIVTLPAGVTPDQIHVQGKDLVVNLADGSTIVIVNGAQNVPTIELGTTTELPAQNVIALLNIEGQPGVQPAAGPANGSGGNFAAPPGAIDPGFGIDPLLPPTELQFGAVQLPQVEPGIVGPPTVTVPSSPTTPGGAPPAGVFAPGTQVFEAGLPAHNGLPAGSAFGNNSEITHGTVTYTAPAGLASITFNGQVLTQGLTITTGMGAFVVNSVNLNTGVITYTYTLNTNTSGANTGDAFNVVVTDAVGQTASATFTVSIVDDAPTARADVATDPAGNYAAITGNVETAAGDSNTGGADTQGADGAHVSGVKAAAVSALSTVPTGSAGVTVHGQYGDLTIHQDGSYSYVRAAGTPGGVSDVFNYQLTDGDGSTSATTLTINLTNSVPTVTVTPNTPTDAGGHNVVNEGGLAAGSHAGDGSNTATGVISYTPGDAPDTVTIGGVAATVGATVTGAHGVLTITGVDTVNHTVSYSYTLTSPITVGNANNGANNEGAGDTFAVVVTDTDGQTANASLVVDVIDDVPSVHLADVDVRGLVLSETHLTQATNGVDGSDPNLALTHTSGSFANAFSVVQGADGATTTYGLAISGGNGTDSGLVDSQTGQHVVLVLNNGVVEGHVGSASGLLSFTVTVDSSGSVTFTQDRAVVQPDATSPDTGEGVHMASGLISLAATVTDHDGDVASASIDLGSHLGITDDGPSVGLADVSAPALTVSETHLTAGTNGIDGTDPNAALTTTTGDFSHLFNVSTGADNGTVVYSLTLAPSEEGPLFSNLIDSQTGMTDVLVQNGNVIEGHVGNAQGELAFTISVDPSTGHVTLTQDRAVVQPDGTNPDTHEGVSLADGLVGLAATVTDTDGDNASASVDVGSHVTFLDDGPIVGLTDVSAPALVVDESYLTAATNGGVDGSLAGTGPTSAEADFAPLFTGQQGADGATGAFSLSITGGNGADSGVVDSQTGLHDVLVLNGNVVEGHVGAANGALAFTIELDPSTGHVTLTQDRAVVQPDGANPDTSEGVSLASNLVILTGTGTDSDGDSSSASVDLGSHVTFLDDGPVVTVADADVPNLVVDESNLTAATNGIDGSTHNLALTHTTSSFAGDFHFAGGADGAILGYALAINGGDGTDSGLVDAQTGQHVVLVNNNGVVEGHVGATDGLLAFTLSVDSSGQVTLTQDRSVDQPLGTEGDTSEGASLAGGLVSLVASAVDSDGDSSSASIDLGSHVSFLDDGPTAHADTGNIASGAYGPIAGNVESNDTQGADGAAVLGAKAAADGSFTAVDSGLGGTVIHGLYGDLTIHQDGSYSYTRSPATPGGVNDVFNYQLQDADGDTSTTTLTITIQPDFPTVTVPTEGGPSALVYEAGLSNGSNPGSSKTVTGVISYTPGDAPDTIKIGGTTITTVGQTVAGSHGTLTITSIDLVGHTIGYSYTLSSPLTVAGAGNNNEGAGDTFAVTVTDTSAHVASGSLAIDVIDDVPTAQADTNSVPAGSYAAVTGNVESNDTQGADTALVLGAKAAAAGSFTAVASGAGGSVIHGLYGDLTIHQDGTYSYARAAGSPGGVSDVFNYQLTDHDGDVSTTTLTISIGNSTPTVVVPTEGGPGALVYEAGLATGSNPGSTKTATGTITYTPGDGPDAIHIGSTSITTVGQTITGAHGTLTITSISAGAIGYSYTLTSPLTVSGAGNNNEGAGDTFSVTVTDTDGSVASGSLAIDVIDDVPTANPDTNSVAAGSYAAVTGNVESNDVQGADTALVLGAKAAAAGSFTAVASGLTGTVVHGLYGDLTIHQDGTYSYARSAGSPGGVSDVFNYQLTDHDGDVSTTTLTIAIGNSTPTVVVPTEGGPNALVYEAGLATGSNPGSSKTVTGSITYTPGDGPDTIKIGSTTITTVGQVIHGTHGDLTITSIDTVGHTVGYSYTLTSPITESPAANNGNDNEGAGDTFSVSVTDTDGSLATGSLKIDVIDDKPSIGTIDNGTATNTVADPVTTGNLHIVVGADQPGHIVSISDVGDNVTAGGAPVVYSYSSGVLTGYVDVDHSGTFNAGDTTVFTLTENLSGGTGPGAGTYTFDLVTSLDGALVSNSVSGGAAFGAGPTGFQELLAGATTVGLLAGFSSGVNATTLSLTGATEGGVNGSTAGWGIGSNNFTAGQAFLLDFHTANTAGMPAGYTPPAGFSTATTETVTLAFPHFSVGDQIKYIVYYGDPNGSGNSGVITHTLTSADITGMVISTGSPSESINYIEIYDVSGSGKFQVVSTGTVANVANDTLHFSTTVADNDGDQATGTFTVNVSGAAAPVVLDLTGHGVHFVDQSAGVTFNYGDGEVQTAWAAPGSGVLALETVNGPVVSFTGFVQGATTDLQGLTAFDTNHDGKLDVGDAQFSQFGVIVGGHLVNLTDVGIASINLTNNGQPYTAANGQVQVAGSGTFTYANGATGALADAAFQTGAKVASAVNDALNGGAHGGPDLDKLIDTLKGGQGPANQNGQAGGVPHGQAYLNLHHVGSDGLNALLHHHQWVSHDLVSGTHHQ